MKVPKCFNTLIFSGKLFHIRVALNLTHLAARWEFTLGKWRLLVDLVLCKYISLLSVKGEKN